MKTDTITIEKSEELGGATVDLLRAAFKVASRDVQLGITSEEQIKGARYERFAPIERKRLANLMKLEGRSEREISRTLRVDRGTVARDLGKTEGTGKRRRGRPPKAAAKQPDLGSNATTLSPETPEQSADRRKQHYTNEEMAMVSVNPIIRAWEGASNDQRREFSRAYFRKVTSFLELESVGS